MKQSLTRYYRCRERDLPRLVVENPTDPRGYFPLRQASTCYGKYSGQRALFEAAGTLRDALDDTVVKDGTIYLPFSPSQAIDNLLYESYAGEWRNGVASPLAEIYYILRPMLPVGLRKHLQRFRLRGWEKIVFPRWPVDSSVDDLMEHLLLLSLKATGTDRLPFIWFWPEADQAVRS